MNSRAELADDFRALGVAPGDTVMVHASVRSVGEIAGGPDQIHLAIKDAITDRGTMVMYASCPEYYDEVGRGVHPGSIGERVWKEMKEVDTSGNGAHANWPDRFFAKIVNAYLSTTFNRGRRVGHAHCFLLDAKGPLQLALTEMRRSPQGASTRLPDQPCARPGSIPRWPCGASKRLRL